MKRYDAVGKVEEVKDDPARSKNEGANGDPQDELPPKRQKGYDPFQFLGDRIAASRLELGSVNRPEQKKKELGRRRRASKAARKARKRG